MAHFQYHQRFLSVLIQEHVHQILWLPVGLRVGIVGYFELPFEPSIWPSIVFSLSFGILRFVSTQDF